MSPHRQLLAAAMRSRAAYDTVSLSGEANGFTAGLLDVWEAVQRYYEADPSASACDPELIAGTLALKANGPKKEKAARDLVADLAAMTVSPTNVAEYARDAALVRAGHSLAARLVTPSDPAELREALDEYTQLLEAAPGGGDSEPDEWIGLIARRVDPGKKWKVTPATLNEALDGGVMPGHNITLFARPEAGKTALAITMACGFARRGKRVLYVGNEESVDDLRVRAVCNLLGKPAHELWEAPEEAELAAVKKGAGNLVFRELAPGTFPELERLVRAVKPEVLVVDQLRNLRSKTDSYTQLLDRAAQFVRALGKRYKLVTISVTQAGDSARNKAVLDDGDVDSSNTGIPGAADVLIGVGVNDGLRTAGQRVLSLCKNKVSARHEHFTVYLDEPTSRFRS